MSGPQRRFDPAELRVPGEPEPSVAELSDALAAARELEALTSDIGIRPTEGFEDRVMAAIAVEPAPRLVVTPAIGVRAGRLGAFLIAVRESWRVASSGGRPVAVRAQALAFVLLVVLAAGSMAGVTVVTVGALIGPNGPTTAPDRSSKPDLSSSTPAPQSSSGPTDSTEPTRTPDPSETAAPGQTATPGQTAKPTETVEPGRTPRPTETPRPTRTPRPTETPKPGETPRPTETPRGTDDHGGGGGGGGGGSGRG